MREITDIYSMAAGSPYETATMRSGVAGFRIPDYQRGYDWTSEKIRRLLFDSLNGFYRLASAEDSYTFLGTIILVEEQETEDGFGGPSLAVVDGQQRLTTLALLACALHEDLTSRRPMVDSLQLHTATKSWLELEVQNLLGTLQACALGKQETAPEEMFPFPRVVRAQQDLRGRSHAEAEYRSPVALLLYNFHRFTRGEENWLPKFNSNSGDEERLLKNFGFLRDVLKNLNNPDWYRDTECDLVSISQVGRVGYRNLFARLGTLRSEEERNRAISDIQNHQESHDLVRMLLFAAYFSKCLVLTRVLTRDERVAFDIFDALNTTGEPLTAIETLRPMVVRHEQDHGGFSGSGAEVAFDRIKEHLDDRYVDTTKKQQETKELIVSFALYMNGKKIAENLAAQRNYLRPNFLLATRSGHVNASRFINALADMAEFRWYYWTSDSGGDLSRYHANSELGEVRLLMSFLQDMRTSLVLPVLARYWNPNIKGQAETQFTEVLRAITAFLVLRRAASGTTAGIDSELRALMSRGAAEDFGLCAGVEEEYDLPGVGELKAALKASLEDSKFRIAQNNKQEWVQRAADNPLYNQARALVRFMLFTAAHQSRSSGTNKGCWEKEGVKPDLARNFLTPEVWGGELYRTVEHIAPDRPSNAWPEEIYTGKGTHFRHSLGNLILLPQRENSAIGSSGWQKKKVFYQALIAPTVQETQAKLTEAESLGFEFTSRTRKLLESGQRLGLLDPLRDVDTWGLDVIEARGRNIAELTWEHVWPWLS